jgi:predicted CXXCH cytochrome family protein
MASSIEILILLMTVGANPAPQRGYCIECHSKQTEKRLFVPTASIAQSVHSSLDMPCAACHGGDPREPTERAHDPSKGYRGKPSAKDVPELCGSCHANATFMRRFSAQIGIDQLAMYNISEHHKAIERGEDRAATCISCHGSHGIKRASDAASPINRKNVVATCAKCHGDASHPARRRSKSDPVADWKRGVHGVAMLQRNETSAAICIDCHGNHGAAPPGIADIHRACGKCHVDEVDRFEKSPHREPFNRLGLRECEECHSNHAIEDPGDYMLNPGEGNVCAKCHGADPAKLEAGAKMHATLQDANDTAQHAKISAAQARRAGLLMPEAEVAEKEMVTALREMRATVHNVDPAVLERGLQIVKGKAEQMSKAVAQKTDELALKRRGYSVFIVLIGAMVGLLVLRIRRPSK